MTIALFFRRAEDRAPHPLFPRRGAGQCVWPLWGDDAALPEKRCCGAPVAAAGKPYCAAHDAAAGGVGSKEERRVAREAREFILKGIGYAGR